MFKGLIKVKKKNLEKCFKFLAKILDLNIKEIPCTWMTIFVHRGNIPKCITYNLMVGYYVCQEICSGFMIDIPKCITYNLMVGYYVC